MNIKDILDKKEITENQFNNLLVFLAVVTSTKNILDNSPSYILEKFNRYIGTYYNIKDTGDHKVGVHQNLNSIVVDAYWQKWNKFDNWPVKDKLEML